MLFTLLPTELLVFLFCAHRWHDMISNIYTYVYIRFTHNKRIYLVLNMFTQYLYLLRSETVIKSFVGMHGDVCLSIVNTSYPHIRICCSLHEQNIILYWVSIYVLYANVLRDRYSNFLTLSIIINRI